MNEITALSGLAHLIENVGFPVVVALILMGRYETKMERLEKHAKDLSEKVNKLRGDNP